MAEYHVGAGLFGIYAGTLNPSGETWRNKSEVTREALCAAAQYLMDNEKEFRFQRKSDEQWYRLKVVPEKPQKEDAESECYAPKKDTGERNALH